MRKYAGDKQTVDRRNCLSQPEKAIKQFAVRNIEGAVFAGGAERLQANGIILDDDSTPDAPDDDPNPSEPLDVDVDGSGDATVTLWAVDIEQMVEQAYQECSQFGLGAMDALHVAAAK